MSTIQKEIREGLGNLQLFKWDAESFYLTKSQITKILKYLDKKNVWVWTGETGDPISGWEDKYERLVEE